MLLSQNESTGFEPAGESQRERRTKIDAIPPPPEKDGGRAFRDRRDSN